MHTLAARTGGIAIRYTIKSYIIIKKNKKKHCLREQKVNLLYVEQVCTVPVYNKIIFHFYILS